ncbi:hypothetical protein IED13_25395 [Bosea sp. SSUT16]|jgi:hypothetical protein|uniref:Uncharacterized protein n=1 Tax=Bosea spartocytisi TaxID=2773451 RepID=A0A927ED22_9HYPH|nr:hypothetical protein [Bosea spartocytisi]MBD3849048.1 hypothetical protein [Bosea spartocytisi]MCT4474331.1 hypothetical protein [Bosea spartocytisi]
MTKDCDIMIGDVVYNALYRLVETWRHNTPHLAHLYSLAELMAVRRREADDRLEAAFRKEAGKGGMSRQPHSPEFLEAWHAHYGEEGAAISGQYLYPGLLLVFASNALKRFRDDMDASGDEWRSGILYGGHSVGELIAAAANGFRHEDEWSKVRTPSSRQRQSQAVLTSALGDPIDGE